MGTKKVTDETFEADVLKNDKPVLVDYPYGFAVRMATRRALYLQRSG